MKNIIIGAAIGSVLTAIFCITQCNQTIEKIKYEDRIRIDTIIVEKIPAPVIVYRTKREIFTETDSIEVIKYLTLIDSIIRWDTINPEIPINVYRDSVEHDDIKLDYTIETLGFLMNFKPTIHSKFKVHIPREKNVSVQFGISTRLNWKIGGGYKGWLLDGEFNKNGGFNEIYLTKQFRF